MKTEFTVGGRTYEVLFFHKEKESYVTVDEMYVRGLTLGASMNEKDGRFILEHKHEIPAEFHDIVIHFPLWAARMCVGAYDLTITTSLRWTGDCWETDRKRILSAAGIRMLDSTARMVRRKK